MRISMSIPLRSRSWPDEGPPNRSLLDSSPLPAAFGEECTLACVGLGVGAEEDDLDCTLTSGGFIGAQDGPSISIAPSIVGIDFGAGLDCTAACGSALGAARGGVGECC